MTAAKAAAVTATSSRIDSLNNRLQSSAGHLVGGVAEEAGTRRRSGENHDLHVVEAEKSEEEPAGERPTEEDQGWEDGELPEDEGDEQPKATGEDDEGEETKQPEEEERSRRRSRTPRPRGGGTAKEVREWAVQQGYEISSRGRIPADIEQAFRDAH
ncbi:Lsr2 family DNA-binding protein [Rhodococcus opacus]|uniref:Lsr2 family DNA-binding protein n=1 Tax=Rhodococcus opacus TaxID=37919 RepID=UPI002953D080|nr:histone-like nucleoid-structuring protein Lsr2 [Rhodococcus opacus]MDV7085636.1 histone-like nucleoid-structuring protein Lsr2 [Rhodococcus opacus]